MKKKKTLYIVLASFLALAAGTYLTLFVLKDKNDKDDNKTPIVIPDAPAENTENLKKEMEKVEILSMTNDTIELPQNVTVETGEKVAVWVYSTPKFLGYFDVVMENGTKKIKGLEEAMKNLEIEPGEHNIAIVTEEGESIGYIDVYVDENKIFEDEQAAQTAKYTTKEVTETVEIKYQTITRNDANKKSGTREVTQKGINGSNKIIYKITYDENGIEISKEKISEETITPAINEIVVVGTSIFGTNTSKITSEFGGFMCTADQIFTDGDYQSCNDLVASSQYKAISIDNKVNYVVKIDGAKITPINVTKSGSFYKGIYRGVTYYFDIRSGGPDSIPLTQELCKEYNLSCGSW